MESWWNANTDMGVLWYKRGEAVEKRRGGGGGGGGGGRCCLRAIVLGSGKLVEC